jgi:Zn-dependent peptidase ImmA (M78 family)/transcriptional regulator with XRE-family HTH domain
VSAPEAFITPELVRWARGRDGASAEDLAQRLHVKPDRIRAWEAGSARPTFRQAQDLAHALHVPFGYLFLSAPPDEDLPVPDLRTVSGEPVRDPSPALIEVTNDLLRKQRWFREFRESEGAEPLAFVGQYTLKAQPETVGAALREVFSLDSLMRGEANSWEHFLRMFVARSEEAGVLVFRSGVVEHNTHRPLNLEEFRGLVLSDPVAPVVFINSQDAKAAQIFTLAHELAHLALGQSGVTDLDPDMQQEANANAIERFCNAVAAEMLLPPAEVHQRWVEGRSIENNVATLATEFRVSAMVALRRAHELGLVSLQEYRHHATALRARPAPEGKAKGDGGNFYATFFTRNSRTFTAALLTALAEQRVLHRDAARLLNVKVKALPQVEQLLLTGV